MKRNATDDSESLASRQRASTENTNNRPRAGAVNMPVVLVDQNQHPQQPPNDAQNSVAASDGASGGAGSAAGLFPHRKPRNFADRLMRFLLNEVATDTLWWVGDGKAVAFHPKKLKRGNLLTTHFKIKDYNAFIRNCNRWGFHRTNEHEVPDGVKVYECSLFQRDAPHLMLHMRMDSDVQDEYLKQVDKEDQKQRKKQKKNPGPSRADILGHNNGPPPSAPVVNAGVQGGQVDLQGFLLQLAQAGIPNTMLSNGQGGAPATATLPGSSQNSVVTCVSNLTGMGSAQGTQNAQPVVPTIPTAPTSQGASSDALLQGLSRLIGVGPNAAPAAPQREKRQEDERRDQLLDAILKLSEVALKHPDQPSFLAEPVSILLKLLQLHIKSLQEERAEQERLQQQESSAVANALAPLLQQVLSGVQGSSQAQSVQLQAILGRLQGSSGTAASLVQPSAAQGGSLKNVPSVSAPIQAQQTIQHAFKGVSTAPGVAQGQAPIAHSMQQQGSFNSSGLPMSPPAQAQAFVQQQQGRFNNTMPLAPALAQGQLQVAQSTQQGFSAAPQFQAQPQMHQQGNFAMPPPAPQPHGAFNAMPPPAPQPQMNGARMPGMMNQPQTQPTAAPGQNNAGGNLGGIPQEAIQSLMQLMRQNGQA